MNEELYLTLSLPHFPFYMCHHVKTVHAVMWVEIVHKFMLQDYSMGLFGGMVMCLASTLDYADSTYPYMKGMLIAALEGEVENTEVQPN